MPDDDRSRRPWRPDEDAVLRANPAAPAAELATALGRSRGAVTVRRCRLGLPRQLTPWTAEQDAVIRAEAHRLPTADLAALVGRSIFAFQQRRRVLGVAL